MTIKKKQFDEGRDETTDCILSLFTNYSDEAFTARELAKRTNIPIMNVLVALINLSGKGAIKGKFVGLDYYYMIA
jgi:predicted Rossmann fold nucleotide-binding protein DprA/Smf involved in DNA uptake